MTPPKDGFRQKLRNEDELFLILLQIPFDVRVDCRERGSASRGSLADRWNGRFGLLSLDSYRAGAGRGGLAGERDAIRVVFTRLVNSLLIKMGESTVHQL